MEGNKLLNYTKGQLTLMNKKEVETICYKLYKQNNKAVLRSDFQGLNKDYLISKYIKLRNKIILS